MHLLRTVVQAVTPTSVFPAPHGSTITPKQILAVYTCVGPITKQNEAYLIEHDRFQTFF